MTRDTTIGRLRCVVPHQLSIGGSADGALPFGGLHRVLVNIWRAPRMSSAAPLAPSADTAARTARSASTGEKPRLTRACTACSATGLIDGAAAPGAARSPNL